MIVPLIPGGINQSQLRLTCASDQPPRLPAMFMQFFEIETPELLPLVRFMGEPLAQSVAGSEGFLPTVKLQPFFADSSRPEAVNQNPQSIGFLRRHIGSFYADLH